MEEYFDKLFSFNGLMFLGLFAIFIMQVLCYWLTWNDKENKKKRIAVMIVGFLSLLGSMHFYLKMEKVPEPSEILEEYLSKEDVNSKNFSIILLKRKELPFIEDNSLYICEKDFDIEKGFFKKNKDGKTFEIPFGGIETVLDTNCKKIISREKIKPLYKHNLIDKTITFVNEWNEKKLNCLIFN